MAGDMGKDSIELTIKLNGELVTFDLGETIYEIAQRHGKFIPTLCYDPRLQPFGACRLCVVDVKGQRNPVASCTTQAVPDMEVSTATERLEGYRRTLLEMVASENPHIAVSPLRGYSSQELAVLMEQYQAGAGRFAGVHSGHSRLDDTNPFILRDYDLCISCYRCVRVCAEQEGDYAISIMNRGFHTQITTEFNGLLRDSACTFCGQCVQTCPTGALGDKKALRAEKQIDNTV
jgi:formate dehydrogenase alpha subunit